MSDLVIFSEMEEIKEFSNYIFKISQENLPENYIEDKLGIPTYSSKEENAWCGTYLGYFFNLYFTKRTGDFCMRFGLNCPIDIDRKMYDNYLNLEIDRWVMKYPILKYKD